ncbi:MAG: DUF5719 family protein [Acidimicrobiia bacterium]
MRWLAVVLIVAGGAAASALPAPEPPAPNDFPEPATPSVAVCPLEEGSGRTTDLTIVASLNRPVEVSVFGIGTNEEPLSTVTGPTGSVTIHSGDLPAVGRVGALVEMSGELAAGFTTAGQGSFAGEPCFHQPPARQTFISGGSTAQGHEFELQLFNPYAGEAVVNLIVQSETGRESNERFDSLVVPARGFTLVDFSRLIPGRQTISVAVEAASGSAVALGAQRKGGDNATWRAVEAVADWYLPIPAGLPGTRIQLATPMNAEVEYQVDLIGPDGLLQAWQSGVLPPRGSATLDLADLGGATAAVRVVAAGPLVPTLWAESEAGLAATTATPVQAGSWLLPGAAAPPGGSGTLVLFNTGVESTVATVRTIRDGAIQQEVSLGVDVVVEVPLAAASSYRVDSDGAIVAMWLARQGGSALAAVGVPLNDG